MGKRELVLIAVFAVMGVVVYRFTAPPAPAGSDLSVGGIFQRMKRGVHGPEAAATVESKHTYPIAAAIRTLRLNLPRPCDLTITGSERDDLSIAMTVSARGYAQAEANEAANAAKLTVDPDGADTLVVGSAWNDRRSGQRPFVTQVAITLAVPRRLRVSLMPHAGLLAVKNVAAVDVTMSRGETHVTGTAGEVHLAHVGGALEIAGGTVLTLNARNSRGEISGLTGSTSIEAAGGRLKIGDLAGALEIDARNTDVTIEKIAALTAPLRASVTGGDLRIDGLRVEARIDGRSADIAVALAAAVPVRIDNVGAIVVTAPPEGYTLDAVATDGRITSEDGAITATPRDGVARAAATVRGGGPALTLRSTNGRIEIRAAGK